MKMLQVPIGSLRANPWNPNVVSPEDEIRIEESMKRLGGFFKPIVVREVDGGFEILGGEHRWQVAKRLGYKEVPIANVGVLDDARAKEISLADNYRYGQDDPLKLHGLLAELGDLDELKTFLPITDDELGAIFAANTLGLDEIADLDKATTERPEPAAKPSPTHQIMRFKVPVPDVARVQALIEKVMKVNGFTGPDSLENAGDALVKIADSVEV